VLEITGLLLIVVVGLYQIVGNIQVKVTHTHETIQPPVSSISKVDPEEVAEYLDPEIKKWFDEQFKKIEL
jgi:hypothetical protein